jgi:hypothetical protein
VLPEPIAVRLFWFMYVRPAVMLARNQSRRLSSTTTVAVFSGKVAVDSGGRVTRAVKVVLTAAPTGAGLTWAVWSEAAAPGAHAVSSS